ncbi:hypothetical protein PAMP_000746 [Pampus punctatissimus]
MAEDGKADESDKEKALCIFVTPQTNNNGLYCTEPVCSTRSPLLRSQEPCLEMGGNQRELARQKNAKKQNDNGKGKRVDDGLSAAARKQRDAEIMQQKQKKADETGKGSTKSK